MEEREAGRLDDKSNVHLTLAGEWHKYSPYVVVLLKELVIDSTDEIFDQEVEKRHREIRDERYLTDLRIRREQMENLGIDINKKEGVWRDPIVVPCFIDFYTSSATACASDAICARW